MRDDFGKTNSNVSDINSLTGHVLTETAVATRIILCCEGVIMHRNNNS